MTSSPNLARLVLAVGIALSAIVGLDPLDSSVSAQRAAPEQDARSLHAGAQRAYAAGRYEVALDLWRRAFALEPRAGIQYNLSQCFGRLGRLEEESVALRNYLEMLERESPERLGDAQADSARQRLIAIDERLGRTGVEFMGLSDDSTLAIDDEPVRADQGRVRLAPGAHTVLIERPGFQPFRTSVSVTHGAIVTVPVVYTPETPVEVREVVVERTVDAEGNPVDVPPRSHRGLAFGLLGGGAAALATGTVLGLVGLSRTREAFDDDEGRALARRYGISADVSFGVGAAMTIASIVVFRVDRKHRDQATVAPVVGAGTVGVTGRF